MKIEKIDNRIMKKRITDNNGKTISLEITFAPVLSGVPSRFGNLQAKNILLAAGYEVEECISGGRFRTHSEDRSIPRSLVWVFNLKQEPPKPQRTQKPRTRAKAKAVKETTVKAEIPADTEFSGLNFDGDSVEKSKPKTTRKKRSTKKA